MLSFYVSVCNKTSNFSKNFTFSSASEEEIGEQIHNAVLVTPTHTHLC